jgi:hypothetical protein
LREYVAGKARGAQLWPGAWPEAGAELIRLDLEAAGIPYAEEAGRVYDLHALRHQFISDLATAGIHPKMAQELARHSPIVLRMDHYTRLELRDRSAALEKPPELPTGAANARANKVKYRNG